jgi:membrane-bound lytic murein transglycosylase B
MTLRRSVLALAFALGIAGSAAANERPFGAWLDELRQEARAAGISAPILDRALAGVQPIPRIIELDRKQPEKTLTFAEYMERVVSERRIDAARRNYDENRALLEEIGGHFGVQPRFIVALWGIETNFGQNMGSFPVVDALATLAYDGRRSAFFRKELLNALRVLDEGHIAPEAMQGSWAGAMGQSQFMPSSFIAFAYDWNKDGRRDIWGTRADVFASIANYLAQSGWKGGIGWGTEIRLPPGFDPSLAGVEVRKPLEFWRAQGVRLPEGSAAQMAADDASVVLPGGADGPALLVTPNYRTILRWNNSLYFASAVGRLADRVGGR